jgi:death-on-curing protein
VKEFVWVLEETVIAIHEEQLVEHGGLSGIRDISAVLSALARPQNLYAYEKCNDVAQLAAAYIYGIAKNHGFADGNKRTSLVVGDLFLMLNGYELTSTQATNVLTIVAVADGSMSEKQLCDWVRENLTKLD